MIDKKAITADERLRQEFNQWAEQSPQVSGSSTSRAQLGQYSSGGCAEPLVGASGV